MSFGSACKEKSKRKLRRSIGQKPNEPGNSTVTTFVKPINNNYYGDGFQKAGLNRINNEIFYLVIQTLGGEGRMMCESTLDRRLYRWKEFSKLVGKCREKLDSIVAILL